MFPLPNVSTASSASSVSGALPDFPSYQPGARYDSAQPNTAIFIGGSAANATFDPSTVGTATVGLIVPFVLYKNVTLDRIGTVGPSSGGSATVKAHIYNGNKDLFLDLGTFVTGASVGDIAEVTLSNIIFPKDYYYMVLRPSTAAGAIQAYYNSPTTSAAPVIGAFRPIMSPAPATTSAVAASKDLTNFAGLAYASAAPAKLPLATIAASTNGYGIVNWRVAT